MVLHFDNSWGEVSAVWVYMFLSSNWFLFQEGKKKQKPTRKVSELWSSISVPAPNVLPPFVNFYLRVCSKLRASMRGCSPPLHWLCFALLAALTLGNGANLLVFEIIWGTGLCQGPPVNGALSVNARKGPLNPAGIPWPVCCHGFFPGK